VAPGQLLEAIRRRTFSQSWHVPDDLMEEAHRRMIDWATEQYRDLTKPVSNIFEFGFDMASVSLTGVVQVAPLSVEFVVRTRSRRPGRQS